MSSLAPYASIGAASHRYLERERPRQELVSSLVSGVRIKSFAYSVQKVSYVSHGARKDGWSRASIPARNSRVHAKGRERLKRVPKSVFSSPDSVVPGSRELDDSVNGKAYETAD